jgi:signal transduction histidine kinase
MDLQYQVMYLINIAITFCFGFFIFYRDFKDKINIAFSLFSFSLVGWLLSLYFYYNTGFENQLLIIGRLNFGFVELIVFFLFAFAYVFPIKCFNVPNYLKFLLTFETILIFILTIFTDFISKQEHYLGIGQRSTEFGDFYILFILHFFSYIIGAIYILVWKIKKLDKIYRLQLLYFIVGLGLTVIFGTATNIIAPFLFKNFTVQNVGSFSTTILMFFTFYAIIKYKFLNIKIFATQIFLVILTLLFLIPLFYHRGIAILSFDVIVFVSIIIFGSLLTQSVTKEIKQREELYVLTKSLEKSNLSLQELDKQKTEFLSIASHQLRTPLSILNGYLELLKDGAYGKLKKPVVEVLDNMDESNGRLIALVDDFLNITRIEQGRVKYEFKKQSIDKLVDSVVNELTDRAEQKGLSIEWKKPKDPIELLFDDEKIRHVIFNYIDNAIKYSEAGKIVVAVKKNDDGLFLTVNDKGIGFDRTDEVNFFKKFYRGENVRGSNVNGTGLGLFVCAKFVEAHHGRVWAKSAGLGQGSEFGFWIPLKQP